jgi:hypothetical protein
MASAGPDQALQVRISCFKGIYNACMLFLTWRPDLSFFPEWPCDGLVMTLLNVWRHVPGQRVCLWPAVAALPRVCYLRPWVKSVPVT